MKLLIPYKCAEDLKKKKLTNIYLVSKLRFGNPEDAQYIVALYIFHRIRKHKMAHMSQMFWIIRHKPTILIDWRWIKHRTKLARQCIKQFGYTKK